MTESTQAQELTEDQFYELFDNVPNPKDQGLYWEHAEVIEADIPTERVWSAMDGDDGSMGLAPGFHVVNVFAYVVSVRPWTDEGIFVIFDSNDDEEDEDEEYDDGKTLIAGVLYDDETGEEADPQ